MRRRWFPPFFLFCLLFLFGVAFIFWPVVRATESYGQGGIWPRLANLFPGSAGLAFNSGVTLYRQREYRRAAAEFSRAIRAKAPGITAAAQYNLGNALFRLGDEPAAGDQGGAAEFYRQAIGEYEQVLRLDGADLDAQFNRAVARNRLQRVQAAHNEQKSGTGSDHRKEGESEGGEKRRKVVPGERDTSEMGRASSGDQAHGRSAAEAGEKGTKSQKQLRISRPEAEALLREQPQPGGATTLFRDARRPGHSAVVLKEW